MLVELVLRLLLEALLLVQAARALVCRAVSPPMLSYLPSSTGAAEDWLVPRQHLSTRQYPSKICYA